jgi:hypothetical protein
MRIRDKELPTESEGFWVLVGKKSVEAMLVGRRLDDFLIEDRLEVIEAAMAKPESVRDKWFQAGVRVTLKKMIRADAQRLLKDPDSISIASAALLKYLTHLIKTDPKFTISARAVQPSKAVRKIVNHDEKGRIKSFTEVEESIVI